MEKGQEQGFRPNPVTLDDISASPDKRVGMRCLLSPEITGSWNYFGWKRPPKSSSPPVPTPRVRAGGDLALSRVPRQQHSRCIPGPCSGSAAARELGAAPLLVP